MSKTPTLEVMDLEPEDIPSTPPAIELTEEKVNIIFFDISNLFSQALVCDNCGVNCRNFYIRVSGGHRFCCLCALAVTPHQDPADMEVAEIYESYMRQKEEETKKEKPVPKPVPKPVAKKPANQQASFRPPIAKKPKTELVEAEPEDEVESSQLCGTIGAVRPSSTTGRGDRPYLPRWTMDEYGRIYRVEAWVPEHGMLDRR